MNTYTFESPIKALQKKKSQLLSQFLKGEANSFLNLYTEILDDYFRESYATSSIGPRIRIDKNPYAIIALGGYGRKEQCLHSDIDVMLLFKKSIPDKADGLVKEIFYPLWDAGLEIGYVTRSLKECISLAREDYEILTALIDARFLCGISSLYLELIKQLRARVLQKHGNKCIQWLLENTVNRHGRYGDSTYLLEPNLKEGLGGLRDFHTMLWIGRIKYELKVPRDLEFFGYLSHDEYQRLTKALLFIWKVRNWLHHLTGRKCDQLYFDYQIKLAEKLEFKKEEDQQPVEVFLGTLHGEMEWIKQNYFNFLNTFSPKKKRFIRKRKLRKGTTKGLGLDQDFLNFSSSEAILHNPRLLIKIFDESVSLEQPLSNEAKRLIKEFRYLIDDDLRKDPFIVESLQRILMSPSRKLNVFNDLLNTGLMTALIPEFGCVINRIQYDEYHLYPVDKHLIRTVEILNTFLQPDADPRHTFYGEIASELDNPEILLWAGLFHDVGKGQRGIDHSTAGAQIVRSVFKRMGFSDTSVETISVLVREHLLLVKTATRRDINDENTILQCAKKFKDTETLEMLYLLSVADSMATGPKAWNDWIDVLVKELFFKIHHLLLKGEIATPAAIDRVKKKREEIFQQNTLIPNDELENIFSQMSPRYLLYTPSSDILKHIALYRNLGKKSFTLDTETSNASGYRTLTICTQDFPGLFSKIAGTLTLNNLHILSAQIYTWRNHIALDIFKVQAPRDRLLEVETWKRIEETLKKVLEERMDLANALKEKFNNTVYPNFEQKPSFRPDKIIIDNESSHFFTIIEIYTHDSPGLLYRITDALFQCKLDIWVAKIGTKVDQVVDVFYVRDFDGQKVDDPREVKAIKKAIKNILP